MASSSKSPSENRTGPFPIDLKAEELGPNRLRVKMREQRPYPYPKDVKVRELVPNKLRVNNYFMWKRQMLGDVITSNGMLGFIDGTVKAPPEKVIISGGTNSKEMITEEFMAWKRSDDLVREWIRSRLTQSVKKKVRQLKTAKEVWDALPPLVEDTSKRLSHYLPLYKAAIEGNWDLAEAFIIGESKESDTADERKKKESDTLRASITVNSETALIVAVKAERRIDFVQKLLDKMSKEDLVRSDDCGRTALHRAAGAGNIKAAELLVKKNQGLINMMTYNRRTPLFYAAACRKREIVVWLMNQMPKRLEGKSGFKVLYQLTHSKLYDDALRLLRNNRELAYFIPKMEDDLKLHALTTLAGQPSSFKSGNNFNFLQELIYSRMKFDQIKKNEGEKFPGKKNEGMELKNSADNRSGGDIEAAHSSNNFSGANGGWGCAVKKILHATFTKVTGKIDQLLIKLKPIREIQEKKLLHDQALDLLQFLCNEVITKDFSNADRLFQLPLEQATTLGIHEFVEKILELYPDAVYLENHKKQTIFQQAIVLRQEKVFNLIHQLEESRPIVLAKRDTSNNNALHLAGYVAQKLYVKAGAALQMQRELQWFKEVDELGPPTNREERNNEEKTPQQVFSDTHKELVKEGERWMKDTATSCTIVASLIATVVFAAAIQVPGGNNDSGHPIFNQQSAFIVFGVANSLALFLSIASVIMFLSILTSPCAEEDFLFALPHRMIIGLGSLFFSILFTMTAFGAILYLVFGENKGWIVMPVILALGFYPVYFFVDLQFPFLKEMMKSTYGSSIFHKESDRMLQ